MDARQSPPKEDELFAAIEEVGPRCYDVTGLPADKPLSFFVLGCQGEEGERQKAVADLMNALAKEKRPAFILFLGDNIYGKALQSALDERFGTRFHQVYHLPELKTIPKMLVLGNHDAALENFTYTPNLFLKAPVINLFVSPYQTGRTVEKFEVAHTYLERNADFYKQSLLSLSTMPAWGMPYYFSIYRFPEAKTALFCLNSNTYAAEAIDFWKNDQADHSKNQIVFFDQHFFAAKRDGYTTLVAMHNPLVTSTKRALPSKYDAHLYLSSKQIQQMNYVLKLMESGGLTLDILKKILTESDAAINSTVSLMPKNGSYADMLLACFNIQGIQPDAVFTAHDHALVYNRTDKLCQVISGAGGSTSLMDQIGHQHDANMGCYVAEPGFIAVTCEADKKLTFEYYTTTGKYLKFTNASHVPVETRNVDDSFLPFKAVTPADTTLTAAAAAASAPRM